MDCFVFEIKYFTVFFDGSGDPQIEHHIEKRVIPVENRQKAWIEISLLVSKWNVENIECHPCKLSKV